MGPELQATSFLGGHESRFAPFSRFEFGETPRLLMHILLDGLPSLTRKDEEGDRLVGRGRWLKEKFLIASLAKKHTGREQCLGRQARATGR